MASTHYRGTEYTDRTACGRYVTPTWVHSSAYALLANVTDDVAAVDCRACLSAMAVADDA